MRGQMGGQMGGQKNRKLSMSLPLKCKKWHVFDTKSVRVKGCNTYI